MRDDKETKLLRFASILERDIDLLVVEELVASQPFQQFILAEVRKQSLVQVPIGAGEFNVLHNTVRSTTEFGQIDSEVMVQFSDGSRLALFIENKIDEEFQDRQPERYREIAACAVRDGECAMAVTVLLAPESYLQCAAACERFDVVLPYEGLIEYFESRSICVDAELARRCQHRKEMLEQAIYKYRRGYCPLPNRDVSEMWMGYYQEACAFAPMLKMSNPGAKVARADWIMFGGGWERDDALPPVALRHKLKLGRVDLEIARWGARIKEIGSALNLLLKPEMRIRLAGKSVAISISVPSMDRLTSFQAQKDAARAGMSAAMTLQQWFCEVRPGLLSIQQGLASGFSV